MRIGVLLTENKLGIRLLLSRYSYDPFQQSPNDNPEAELTVNSGDYLLVWGTMDEVGYQTSAARKVRQKSAQRL